MAQFPVRISHDVAFEWSGKQRRRNGDAVVDASLFHVSTGEPAFRVTGKFRPAAMTGHFYAIGRGFELQFDLDLPAWITVMLDNNRVCFFNVRSGAIGTDKQIGHWERRSDNAVDVRGVQLARMTVGSGHVRRVPSDRNSRSARIFWGPPVWSDLEEVIRLAAIVIDTVFFVPPGSRERFLEFMKGPRQPENENGDDDE